MRRETIAIHSGYETEPTTKSVAVPIYQTAAYEFDSAEHAAALFNLEQDGFRYSRINNPTNAVLERRVAALEGGVEALCVASGQAALNYATLNVTEPRLQPRLGAAALRHDLHAVRPRLPGAGRRGALRRVRHARRDREADRRQDPRGVLRERRQSGRQHLRHRGARRGRAPARRAADRRQHGRDADPAAPDRVRRRHRGAFAHQVHGRPRHHARRHHRRQRPLPMEKARRPLPDVQPA